ncbi:MAG: hypothetical protein GX660_05820 [Clostridiaceae bacterium]|nr:hypothetical protein [Clostridiaceae bacterium]
MKIPEKLKIGAFEWTIVLNPDLMHGRSERGCCRPKTSQIDIDPGYNITGQEETFVHEMLEAITAQYDITIEHKDLSNLATVLHQVIKDNPEVFAQ